MLQCLPLNRHLLMACLEMSLRRLASLQQPLLRCLPWHIHQGTTTSHTSLDLLRMYAIIVAFRAAFLGFATSGKKTRDPMGNLDGLPNHHAPAADITRAIDARITGDQITSTTTRLFVGLVSIVTTSFTIAISSPVSYPCKSHPVSVSCTPGKRIDAVPGGRTAKTASTNVPPQQAQNEITVNIDGHFLPALVDTWLTHFSPVTESLQTSEKSTSTTRRTCSQVRLQYHYCTGG